MQIKYMKLSSLFRLELILIENVKIENVKEICFLNDI